jgi:hypothetical protein
MRRRSPSSTSHTGSPTAKIVFTPQGELSFIAAAAGGSSTANGIHASISLLTSSA